MQAAVVRVFGEPLVIEPLAIEPLVIEERPRPEPGPGLGHTGIHAAHGDRPLRPNPPFVPGHKGVGRLGARIVFDLGAGW